MGLQARTIRRKLNITFSFFDRDVSLVGIFEYKIDHSMHKQLKLESPKFFAFWSCA